MANPELRVGRISARFSVACMVEADNKLLLVEEADGYGPPAGHLEEHEWGYPKAGMFWELAEETNIAPSFDELRLWGIMIHPSRALTIGLVYRLSECNIPELPISDPEILSVGFFDRDSVRSLLDNGQIRKTKWNEPLLYAWLDKKRFLLKVF